MAVEKNRVSSLGKSKYGALEGRRESSHGLCEWESD